MTNVHLSDADLQRLHQVQLEMLLELDRVCRCLGLTYQLGAGSLLGAVRHGGFIPWDDDVDVVMLRAEPATMTAYRVEGMRFEPALADPVFAERWRQRGDASGPGGRGESLMQRRLALSVEDRAALAKVRAEMAGMMRGARRRGATLLR